MEYTHPTRLLIVDDNSPYTFSPEIDKQLVLRDDHTEWKTQIMDLFLEQHIDYTSTGESKNSLIIIHIDDSNIEFINSEVFASMYCSCRIRNVSFILKTNASQNICRLIRWNSHNYIIP